MDGWMDASRRRRMLGEGRRGPAAAEGVGEREREERERGGWGLVEGR